MAGPGQASIVERDGTFYDRQEVRNAAEREASMFHALPGLIRHALDNAPFFADRFAGIEPDSVTSRAALAALPVMRRADLVQPRAGQQPFGGVTATPTGRLARVLVAAEGSHEPEGTRPDYWRLARALYAAGCRSGELIHQAGIEGMRGFGLMIENGARALGCPIVRTLTDDLEVHRAAIADVRPVAYGGSASFLLELLDRGGTRTRGAGPIRMAIVTSAEAGGSAAERLRDEFKIAVYGCLARTDLGLIAYETPAHDGLVVDESVIIEIVRPGSGEPLPPGTVGELVVTVFNPDYPLIRFGTGELSAILPGLSPCGRTNTRLRGWLGRVAAAAVIGAPGLHGGHPARP